MFLTGFIFLQGTTEVSMPYLLNFSKPNNKFTVIISENACMYLTERFLKIQHKASVTNLSTLRTLGYHALYPNFCM